MEFIDISTEQTTSITDLMIFLLTTSLGIMLLKLRGTDRAKTGIWVTAFFALSMASFLGFVAHGFKMPPEMYGMLWKPLNFFLGLTIAFIGLGVIYDINGFKLPGIYYYVAILLAILFFLATIILPGGFFIFIIYEALVMLFALVAYIILFRKGFTGAGKVLLGILFTIMAAVIQAIGNIEVKIIWTFDHNGIFHLVQMVGVVFLYSGLKLELEKR